MTLTTTIQQTGPRHADTDETEMASLRLRGRAKADPSTTLTNTYSDDGIEATIPLEDRLDRDSEEGGQKYSMEKILSKQQQQQQKQQQQQQQQQQYQHQQHENLTAAHPLFPPLPTYGTPSFLWKIHSLSYRCVSFVLSLSFLTVVVIGALGKTIWVTVSKTRLRLTGVNPETCRKFYKEEQKRKVARKEAARRWKKRKLHGGNSNREVEEGCDEFPPLEGGKEKIVCDVRYYARRVGLDVETFKVQTEDGFVIRLWHVYNPKEYTALSEEERGHRGPHVFTGKRETLGTTNRRYPVLLMHGLLQNSGAFCTNDDDSLAFFLCKSGYDVWLGNNRCGMWPEHTTLKPSDPRMWTWNIRHLGMLDLTALISRVLYETGFDKLGLIGHSQGTTQTLVALAKDHRPELGEKISVFCALAPAAYAGPLIERKCLRFITTLSPGMFRMFFGIHAFIPFMMTMHSLLPARVFGTLGYHVFSFLFNWSDDRWDRGLRHRMFQFAPVYISAETMHWWLGRDCFAKHKSILSTLEEEENPTLNNTNTNNNNSNTENQKTKAWFNAQTPPFALWIGGSDGLVDGSKLLKRFRSGREPHVRVIHAKIIEEYEHLDLLWAMDAVEQVGKEVREVVWMTVPDGDREVCRVPRGVSLV